MEGKMVNKMKENAKRGQQMSLEDGLSEMEGHQQTQETPT